MKRMTRKNQQVKCNDSEQRNTAKLIIIKRNKTVKKVQDKKKKANEKGKKMARIKYNKTRLRAH